MATARKAERESPPRGGNVARPETAVKEGSSILSAIQSLDNVATALSEEVGTLREWAGYLLRCDPPEEPEYIPERDAGAMSGAQARLWSLDNDLRATLQRLRAIGAAIDL